jgi:CRP/FNR family cyclic AMP-dependent transcriptional regulator
VDDVLALCQGLPEQRYAPGEALLGEGTRSGRLFVLIEGAVQVERERVAIVHLEEPGIFLGEISALLGVAHGASVVATAPTRCHVIEDAATSLADHPELLGAVARLLARRLNAMTTYLVDIKRQYGGEDGHLGMMDEVLSQLMSVRPLSIQPGSAREDQPDY